MDWFEIFKVGTHTDSAGRTREWTDDDLATIAKSYDPARHEAPIVLGHPADDAPAYGWIEALKVEAGKLLAKPKQVADELKAWVQDGRYKKVSIALYPDLSLRHVGFLGAQPPAVKGLAQAAFADAGRAWTYIEPWQERTITSLFARLRDFLIAEKGLETADKIISPWDVEALEVQPPAEAPRGYTEPHTPAHAGGGQAMKEWFAKLQAGLIALFAEAEKTLPASGATGAAPPDVKVTMYSEADVQAKIAEAAATATKAAEVKAAREARARDVRARVAAFVEAGTKAGTYIPAWTEAGLPAVLEQALLVEAPLQFADGKEAKNPGEILLAVFGQIPKLVEFKEIAKPGAQDVAGETAAATLDALTKKRSDEKKIPYGAAFAEVQIEHPDLAQRMADDLRGK